MKIVNFPIEDGGSFHSLNVYQRVWVMRYSPLAKMRCGLFEDSKCSSQSDTLSDKEMPQNS